MYQLSHRRHVYHDNLTFSPRHHCRHMCVCVCICVCVGGGGGGRKDGVLFRYFTYYDMDSSDSMATECVGLAHVGRVWTHYLGVSPCPEGLSPYLTCSGPCVWNVFDLLASPCVFKRDTPKVDSARLVFVQAADKKTRISCITHLLAYVSTYLVILTHVPYL